MEYSGGYRLVLLWAVAFSPFCFQVSLQQDLRDISKDLTSDQTWDSERYNEEAGQTFHLLFRQYNPMVRPPDRNMEVNADIILTHLRHLDVRKQELQVVLDLNLHWQDSRLRWDPDRVKEINQPTESVWTPEIIYLNGVEPIQQLYPNVVKISHNGSVRWMRKEIVTTKCDTILSTKHQTCGISIGFVTNSPGQSVQHQFFFTNTSTASIASDVDVFNHEWMINSLELVMEDENATISSTLDLSLDLEMNMRDGMSLARGGSDDGGGSGLNTKGGKNNDESCQNGGSSVLRMWKSVDALLCFMFCLIISVFGFVSSK